MRICIYLILALLLTACDTPSQLYWDHKVAQFCKKDGGITVYENMRLSKKDYPHLHTIRNGSIILPPKERATENDPAYIEWLPQVQINKSPEVLRFEMHVVRAADKKILAKKIEYARIGGDFIALHPSHYSCEIDEESILKLAMTVTFNENE